MRAAGLMDATVITLPIQVAALLTTPWVERKLTLPAGHQFEMVVLPGYCRGDVKPLSDKLGVHVVIGPQDMRDLPEFFGQKPAFYPTTIKPTLEIIAEINHASSLRIEQIVTTAQSLAADGADVIDLGCDPQTDRPAWTGLATVVRELTNMGLRVSVDSFHPEEVASACQAGASLVLSVNSNNAHLARQWHGAEVVVIPDDPHTLEGLNRSLDILTRDGVKFRIDPIIEPIGFGFAASLGRYLDVRRRYPDAPMMMGIGNLSELTEVDSAGVNTLLVGFCLEQQIHSVLTTQVANWARSSVKEIDIARRMIQLAVENHRPPKRIDSRLVMLRDRKLKSTSAEELNTLAQSLTDANIRLFTHDGQIHAMNRDFHLQSDDSFDLFDQMGIDNASHAFYLGYEMAKAMTAITLGKNYTQDQALSWGMHTIEEKSRHERRQKHRSSPMDDPSNA